MTDDGAGQVDGHGRGTADLIARLLATLTPEDRWER